MSLSTYEQLRACHVKRWHIVQTAREQTLAEHSFAVAVIAGSLATAMGYKGLMHSHLQLRLLQWALSHDIMEVRTGDTPTPFKHKLEEAAGYDVVHKAEELTDHEASGAYRIVKGTEIETIVKLADQIEAIFFLQDNGIGAHALQVLDGLRSILSTMVDEAEVNWPELNVRSAVRKVLHDVNVHGGWI